MDTAIISESLTNIIQRYDKNGVSNSELSEDDVCRIYVLPMLEALGWDIHDQNEIRGQKSQPQGRPDYVVYINGNIAFFLEAKAIKELSESDIKQALNYARSKNKRWAVLSNFKETIILVCDTKESTIAKHIFRRIPYNELSSINDIALLSKESFASGLIDKRAQAEGRVRQPVRIDEELLNDVLKWRESLISSIDDANPDKYSDDVLEEIAQTLLNRIIFIRTAEDRKHEAVSDETIRGILNQYEKDNKIRIDNRMNKLFLEYDKIYDSKLFTYDENDQKKRHECERVTIDNETYYQILKQTYDKDAIYSYNFGDIDADVLGAMYEKYIGRIQSKRHDQGIYYTPTYIVDYIVQNTLGKVLKPLKKPTEAYKIKILDMACGSGSFLLRSFDLLDDWYRNHDKDYAQSKLELETNAAKMTKKALILKTNIFGVDLDPKAVEITQLNLLLRAAETRYRLPNLINNIKFGNSLISQSLTPEMYPMEWNKEFSEIMSDGGFDVVIGNPPYVRQEEFLDIKPYLERNYEVYHSMADLYVYFFERELKVLKEGGYFGMIVSNKWLKAGYGKNLRRFLNKFFIEQYIDFGDLPVFQDATTYPCIIIIRNIRKTNPKVSVCLVKTLDFDIIGKYINSNKFIIHQNTLDDEGWNFVDSSTFSLIEKIKKRSVTLGDYVENQCYFGIKTGLTEAYVIDENEKVELIKKDPSSADLIKPFLLGKEVRPYYIEYNNKYIILAKIGIDIKKYPAILERMNGYKTQLEKRSDQGDYWYQLRSCDYYDLFEKPKLIYGSMTTGPRFTIDYDGYYANNANFFIPTEDKKLLGILNSKLGWFLIANTCTQIRGGYQLIWKYLKNVPIVKDESPTIVNLVDQIIKVKEQIASLGNIQNEQKRRLEIESEAFLKKIDEAVYDLYGLTQDERKIVDEFS